MTEERSADVIIQIAKPVLEQKKLYLITKRAFDIVCSFLGLLMPEPVVDANPYFFFAILMLLGGIKGVECSFGKEDTAESERGF